MSTVSWELRFSRQHTVVSAIFSISSSAKSVSETSNLMNVSDILAYRSKTDFQATLQQSYNSIVAYTFMESKLLKISWFYFAKYLLGSIFFTTKFNPQIFSPSNFSTLKISEVLKANAAWNSIAIWGKNGWILIFSRQTFECKSIKVFENCEVNQFDVIEIQLHINQNCVYALKCMAQWQQYQHHLVRIGNMSWQCESKLFWCVGKISLEIN